MGKTHKTEEPRPHEVNACRRENTPKCHIEVQCPNCKDWQSILIAPDNSKPLRENEFYILPDANCKHAILWPFFVCQNATYIRYRRVELCPWNGLVELVIR